MNFPESQRTGLLGEIAVEQLFTQWNWTTGRDRLDVGYDHFVEPDQAFFSGARFLVQTKGTAKNKKGRIVAQVSKARLRQYAANPLPVFIVRVLPDGELLWVHAQAWCAENMHKLSGAGSAGVVFSQSNKLSNRRDFESYLSTLLLPPESRAGSVNALAIKRADYLSSIDSRFKVGVFATTSGEGYEISAADPSQLPSAKVQFRFAGAEEQNLAAAKLTEHVEFGMPATFDFAGLEMSGSPLFAEVGLQSAPRGRIDLPSTPVKGALIRLIAGDSYQITSPSIASPSLLHRGIKGLALTPEFRGPVSINAKFHPEESEVTTNFDIKVDSGFFSSRPLSQLTELPEVKRWAEAVIAKNALLITVDGPRGGRIQFNMAESQLENLVPILHGLRILAMAQAIAGFVGSDLIWEEDIEVSEKEFNLLDIAYRLLRGERMRVPVTRVAIDVDAAQCRDERSFILKTPLMISVGGRAIGEVPAIFELDDFRICEENGRLIALEADGNTVAHAKFDDEASVHE